MHTPISTRPWALAFSLTMLIAALPPAAAAAVGPVFNGSSVLFQTASSTIDGAILEGGGLIMRQVATTQSNTLQVELTGPLLVDTPGIGAPARLVDAAGRTRGGWLGGTSNGGLPDTTFNLRAGGEVSDGYLFLGPNFANLTVANFGSFVQRGTGSLLLDPVSAAATFRNEAGATYDIRNDLPLETGANALAGPWPATIVNAAGANFTKSAGSVTSVNVAFNNEGTVTAASGLLQFSRGGSHQSGTFTSTAQGASITFGGTHSFNGNSWLASGRFNLAPNARLLNDGRLDIGGLNGTVVASPSANAQIRNNGQLSLLAGASLQGRAQVTNTGSLDIDQGTSLQAGSLTQTAGTLTVNGTLTTSPGYVDLQGGTLAGSGRINGDVFIGGSALDAIFRPGNSPGHMSISGALTMGDGSELELQVERQADGSLAWDSVSAGSMSFLAGSTVHFLVGAGVAGADVQTLSFLDCGSGCSFEPGVDFAVDGAPGSTFSYGASGLVLTIAPAQAVPEPAGAWLMLAGAAALVVMRRRPR